MNEPARAEPDATLPYFQRLRELFDRITEMPAAERDAEIARAAAEDPRLGNELRALLEHSERSASALDNPTLRLADAEEFVPTPAIPGYRIRRRIGRGGSATVYLADQEHAGFERVVALKVVDRVVGATGLRQVREEQRILARLEHPGIARLYDAGATALGQPYLAMEHVEGTSILDHCRSRNLPLRARIELFLSVADAVIYAHSRSVVHRDLKPANILVSTRGETKLLDFGIARLLADPDDTDETRTLQRAMTPAYASPEQMRGERVTHATDIYSLGVVLYELLSGTTPFRLDELRVNGADSSWEPDLEPPSAAFARTASSNPSTTARDRLEFARWRRALRGDLDAVLLKALRRKPEARYASAAAFADDLRRVLAGEPVAARRGDRIYRAGKFLRRHRRAAAVLMVVLSLVAIQQVGARWRRGVFSPPDREFAAYRESPSPDLRAGAERLAMFDAAGARERFQQAVTASRGNPAALALAWDGLSRAHAALGEPGRASEAARRAGQLVADGAGLSRDEAERIRARSRLAAYDWNAIAMLEELFGRHPDRVDIGLDLVNAHLATGRTEQADNALGRLRQLHADPRIDLVEAEVALRLSEFQRAAAAATRARDGAARVKAEASGLRAERLHAEALGRLDRPDEAQRNLESLLTRDLAAGLHAEAAATRLALALILSRTRPSDEMRPRFEEVLAAVRAAGLRASEVMTLVQLSLLAGRREEFAEGLRISDAALQSARAIGDRWSEGYALSQRLVLLNWADDENGAMQIVEPALAALRESGNRTTLLATLTNVASVRIERLDLDRAAANLDEAEAIARRIGSQPASAKVDRGRGYLQQTRGDLDLARQSFTHALEKGRRGGAPLDLALTLAHLAWLEMSADRPDQAAPHAREAMEILQTAGHTLQAASMEAVLAWVDARRGDAPSAERRLATVHKTAADEAEPQNFQLLSTEARVAEALGEWSRAVAIRNQTIGMAREWDSAGLLMEERLGLARALHGMGNQRELQRLVAEMLPEVERAGLRGHARNLRALVAQ